MANYGTFYGIGVGPGDPDLLTIKAARVLNNTPVICVPKSAEEAGSLALSIIEKHVDLDGHEIVELLMPMTKDQEVLRQARETAAETILAHLRQGRDCAFITIGDPLFYSTFSYLMALVEEREPQVWIEVIPGISSVMASAAATRIPLTEADERLAVIPATYGMEKIREALERFETVVLMKLNRVFDDVCGLLDEMGLLERAHLISRCGHEQQMLCKSLEGLKGTKIDYMTIMIVKSNGRHTGENRCPEVA
ncbi:MAG: precorrin-2 C(20)-methyltransferase [Nitrospirota bacterium]|nr:precorrin-2 C(20)-methyltransferase [Nitrospirota bacterium]